jgi:hypothetical protein
MWKDAGAAMLRPDLELAGFEYETEKGVADFHALRRTCDTLLNSAGVHPHKVREIMRHSDVNLTMRTYTRVQDSEMDEAISKLPSTRTEKKKQSKACTSDVPECSTVILTGNTVKHQRNSLKYSKVENCSSTDVENIKPCETNHLTIKSKMRVLGFESGTYGLKGHKNCLLITILAVHICNFVRHISI